MRKQISIKSIFDSLQLVSLINYFDYQDIAKQISDKNIDDAISRQKFYSLSSYFLLNFKNYEISLCQIYRSYIRNQNNFPI